MGKEVVDKKSSGIEVKQFQSVCKTDFSDQCREVIIRYKRTGYNINVMRQSACLVFIPITVNKFASFFISTPVGSASHSRMGPA